MGGLFVQMDTVVNEAFTVLDADAGGSVDRQDFDKSLLEVIGSIMLQLSGKPIGVQSSGIVPPQRATSGIMPFWEQQQQNLICAVCIFCFVNPEIIGSSKSSTKIRTI